MVMEFEEFAKQFRQRTTQRMTEFEKALAQAQTRVEKAVQEPPPPRRSTPGPQPTQPPPYTTKQPRPASSRGRVQGLLRNN